MKKMLCVFVFVLAFVGCSTNANSTEDNNEYEAYVARIASSVIINKHIEEASDSFLFTKSENFDNQNDNLIWKYWKDYNTANSYEGKRTRVAYSILENLLIYDDSFNTPGFGLLKYKYQWQGEYKTAVNRVEEDRFGYIGKITKIDGKDDPYNFVMYRNAFVAWR